MKTILDEGVPRKMVGVLRALGCAVDPLPNDWKGQENGRLLRLVGTAGYSCLLTCDKNLAHQQNLAAAGMAVVVLPTHDLATLKDIGEPIAAVVGQAQVGRVHDVPTLKT